MGEALETSPEGKVAASGSEIAVRRWGIVEFATLAALVLPAAGYNGGL
jgi:hypothetical protein